MKKGTLSTVILWRGIFKRIRIRNNGITAVRVIYALLKSWSFINDKDSNVKVRNIIESDVSPTTLLPNTAVILME